MQRHLLKVITVYLPHYLEVRKERQMGMAYILVR